LSYLLPPPAAMTMNCLPVFFPRLVMGVAMPLAGSFVTQSSSPVSLSKARDFPLNNKLGAEFP
jgi:hypothetical protein